jgi:hypothetical protein
MKHYITTAAYVSGAITGHMWMPAAKAGLPFRADVRCQIDRFSDPRGTTFRDVLLHMLMEHGGDFQDARFTADTVLRVERRAPNRRGYCVHVFERHLGELRDCADLVDESAHVHDFLSED